MSNLPDDNPPLSSVARELSDSFKSVIRSEVHLAKAELKENGTHLAKHSMRIGLFGAVAAFGIFPLLAFFVIGLGDILGGHYWLSALIVAVLMIGIGGALAYAELQKIKKVDLKLPDTRDSVVRNIHTVDRKLHDVTETAKRRAAS